MIEQSQLVADVFSPARMAAMGCIPEWMHAFHARMSRYLLAGCSLQSALILEREYLSNPDQADVHELAYARGELAGELAATVDNTDLAAEFAATGLTQDEIQVCLDTLQRIKGDSILSRKGNTDE